MIILFSIDIDSILTNSYVESDIDVDRLSDVIVTSDNIAYIIFTSGSTGIPKAVSDDHNIMYSNNNIYFFLL